MLFIKYLIIFCLIYEICSSYNMVLKKFEVMPETDPKFMDFGTVRILKKSRTEVEFSGTFYLFQKITNNFQLTTTVSRIIAGGLPQQQIFIKTGKFCDYIAEKPQFYDNLVEHSNLPQEYCPLKSGNYTLNNHVIHLDYFPKVIPLGEYVVTIVISLNGQIKMSYKILVLVNN